jgi:hypothetical protein
VPRRGWVTDAATRASSLGSSEALVGQTVRILYPNQVAFEQFGACVIPALKEADAGQSEQLHTLPDLGSWPGAFCKADYIPATYRLHTG